MSHIGCIGEGCPICEKFSADPEKYAKIRERLNDHPRAPVKKAVRFDCLHRKERLPDVLCEGCGDNKTLAKVDRCELHGPCSLFNKLISDVKPCNSCEDYKPKEA